MHPDPDRLSQRHIAAVPKGFLKYHVLRLLDGKPMSGSEITQDIERQTEGCWKPSPGSIYPLLIWLQSGKYIKETAEQKAGIKRYALTGRGKTLLREHSTRIAEFPERFRFFAPPMWFQFYPERAKELREATRRLVLAVWNFRDRLQHEYSKTAANEAKEALEEAAQKIESITGKLKEVEE